MACPVSLTASRFHGQKRALVVARNVIVRSLDFIIQAREAADVLVGQNCERKVDQENQGDSSMDEVCQESGLDPSHCCVYYDYGL